MKILVLGSGGREHALAWKLRQSSRVTELFVAPGNAGTAAVATNVPIKVADATQLVAFAKAERIDLTVVGPDDALAAGIVDLFETNGLRIFGPTQSAARLESSKAFAKEFMQRHGIPTAHSETFSESGEAHRYCQRMKYPVVIKADGLALGKGVYIAPSPWSAARAIHEIMEERRFGDAGQKVVIEEFLQGEECSIHALVDGRNYLLFPSAQDHKRARDGDAGPNTGGMGAFSPAAKLIGPAMEARIRAEILERFIDGLQRDGIDYRGMLFPGLMITADGPKVLEFNCRFGDPETQVLLPRLESDLLDLLEATIDRRLDQVDARWSSRSAVCVVVASKGYPESSDPGQTIAGLQDARDGVTIFHAGTRQEGESILTAGGRVLGVTAVADTLDAARDSAYAAVQQIEFSGRQFRTDIAAKGLRP